MLELLKIHNGIFWLVIKRAVTISLVFGGGPGGEGARVGEVFYICKVQNISM